jgi:hypothetical protein
MSDLTPIETKYKGYRMRSRLEARWAIVFDCLGLTWDYEPEGFDLNGVWYLPDFHIPALDAYIEIKPINKWFYNDACLRLAAASKKRVLYIAGSPYPKEYRIAYYAPSEENEAFCSGSDPYVLAIGRPDPREIWLLAEDGSSGLCLNRLNDSHKYATAEFSDVLMRAFQAARSARFEHGEKGSY